MSNGVEQEMSVLFIAVSLLAASPDAATQAAVPTPTPVKERKICHDEPETGSLISKRTCHTKAEWDAINKASARDIDAFRNKPMQSPVHGG
jgi:hypothetical protein